MTLAARILADDATLVYTGYLLEGNDIGGIDTGFLVRDTVNVTGAGDASRQEHHAQPRWQPAQRSAATRAGS